MLPRQVDFFRLATICSTPLFTRFLNRAPFLCELSDWIDLGADAVIARNAHSSVHLGVGLRILLATREISPFSTLSRATQSQIWDFLLLLFTWQFFLRFTQFVHWDWTSITLRENFPKGAICKERANKKEACGLCSFLDRLSFFVGAKAWERNSPRPLQKAKPWQKSQERWLLHLPRLMDRYILSFIEMFFSSCYSYTEKASICLCVIVGHRIQAHAGFQLNGVLT